AFRTQILDRLTTADGQPRFHTTQELIDLLASQAASAIGLGLDYDAVHQELVFSLNFTRNFDATATLDLGVNVPHLADLHIDNPQVQVHAVVTGGLVFGIRLGDVANEGQLTASTPLSQVNGASPVPLNSVGGDHTDLEIRLTDGTVIVVDLQSE